MKIVYAIGLARVVSLKETALDLFARDDVTWRMFESIDSACDYEQRNDQSPQLIVLLLNHADEIRAAYVDEIMMRWPICRVMAIGSQWLASSLRTRSYLPAAWLVSPDEARSRFEKELRLIEGDFAGLPVTASLAEVFRWNQLS